MPVPRHRRTGSRAALLAAAAVLTLAGCSSTAPHTGEQAFTLTGADTTVAVATTEAGAVLTDGAGRVLYARVPGGGPCTGECAAQWPAYVAEGVPHPADGTLNPLRVDRLGTVVAPDGAEQVAYAGHALHRFAGDTAPGTIAGQGVEAFGGTWFPVNPNGEPVRAAAVAP
ncbi:putative lipoprotein [Pseudonocardia sp. Ae168_Ps1]|uniref:COG4315 family predicted lipoprotein n=1 Tax=unclassified Pseudonocardia TaxID=2619320 RepID=UPI00094B30F8|nr:MULTISPECIES: hypothetical protein [unclassified Pseudonocardia]OLL74646.1 putative lipoprotein [Pseudonocardia sp. Ae150A_Ps1]OLL80626.1 putative lipoprotein [Pseudonocardia sp. Ae168_Ps1]OLL85246.1 putative lipoprotein [Pseudonocardia sp. Ae263_Ps1]OLL94729.1 putative lipoprotein [Pseudonocardia sp. Ae356_Ps1]